MEDTNKILNKKVVWGFIKYFQLHIKENNW